MACPNAWWSCVFVGKELKPLHSQRGSIMHNGTVPEVLRRNYLIHVLTNPDGAIYCKWDNTEHTLKERSLLWFLSGSKKKLVNKEKHSIRAWRDWFGSGPFHVNNVSDSKNWQRTHRPNGKSKSVRSGTPRRHADRFFCWSFSVQWLATKCHGHVCSPQKPICLPYLKARC